jgi:hypothetical protein
VLVLQRDEVAPARRRKLARGAGFLGHRLRGPELERVAGIVPRALRASACLIFSTNIGGTMTARLAMKALISVSLQ